MKISLPLNPWFLLILIILIPLIFFLFFVNLITLSFTRIGFPPYYAFLILTFSIVGSGINIPVREIKSSEQVLTIKPSRIFGLLYPKPVLEYKVIKTTIAVNVGGAVIPILISIFLITKFPFLLPKIILGTLVVVAVCYYFAKPVPHMGIAIPTLIPPLTSAIVSIFLTVNYAPALAYVSGVLGVLIGADLLNLPKIKNLQTPFASIGGAGTFDGIFLTGIISVLLV